MSISEMGEVVQNQYQVCCDGDVLPQSNERAKELNPVEIAQLTTEQLFARIIPIALCA